MPEEWLRILSGIGGFIGGRFFKNIPTLWLHRVFGVLLLWGGFKAVFGL